MSPLVVRRCIYGLLLVALSTAVLLQLRFPETPSPRTRTVFQTIESLPEGSRVLFALDYDPAAQGELAPMSAAFVRHMGEKRHRIYFLTLWDTGLPILQQNVAILRSEYAERNLVEGRDYVNFGFKPGKQVAISNSMADLSKDFPTDARGIRLKDMPLTRNLRNLSEVDLLVSVGAGYPGTQEWVQYAATPKDLPMVAGSPGVQAPALFPYVPRQLIEVVVSIKGAAEYEQLLEERYPHLAERPGTHEAGKKMGPQVVAHVLIIALIVAGNALTFWRRESTSHSA